MKQSLADVLELEVDLVILNKAAPLLKMQVLREGVLVFCRDHEVLKEFRIRTIFEYEDIRHYQKLAYDKAINRVKEELAGGQ